MLANAIANSYFKQVTNRQMSVLVKDPKVSSMVGIAFLERAKPGNYSIKPNTSLNIALGGFFGLLVAGALGGAAFFISKSRQRNRAAGALAGN